MKNTWVVTTAKISNISLCLLGSVILGMSSLVTTINPASAEIKERDLILNFNSNQSFETLIQQAEDLAKQSIEREFTEKSTLTEVSLTILVERHGQIVPFLRSKVSRSQWQKDANIRRWTQYLVSNSGVLLGFYNPSVSPTPQVSSGEPTNRDENEPDFRDD
ncbi:MAG: hypothetical protein U7123_17105 [Potamolinea sp.]